MAFKPIDPKRDEFRRYLERAGVIEALTKVFARMVKERPENPLEYLRHNISDAKMEADDMAYLQHELEESRAEIQRLRDLIQSISPEALNDSLEMLDNSTADDFGQQQAFGANSVSDFRVDDGAETMQGNGHTDQVAATADAAATPHTEITNGEAENNEANLNEAVNNCHIFEAKPSVPPAPAATEN